MHKYACVRTASKKMALHQAMRSVAQGQPVQLYDIVTLEGSNHSWRRCATLIQCPIRLLIML